MLNDLYFKTTCNIRHFPGPMDGLKMEGLMYVHMCAFIALLSTVSCAISCKGSI